MPGTCDLSTQKAGAKRLQIQDQPRLCLLLARSYHKKNNTKNGNKIKPWSRMQLSLKVCRQSSGQPFFTRLLLRNQTKTPNYHMSMQVALELMLLKSFQFIFLFFFFPCVALPVLELALQSRLASNSQRSTSLCLLSTGIKGICHHCPVLVTYQHNFLEVSLVRSSTISRKQ